MPRILRLLITNQSKGAEESPVFGRSAVEGSTHPSIACHYAYSVMERAAVKFVSAL